ncbi:hypothetical protein GCM10025864_17570 [Luteimicrobium album]|uniref:peptidylprolyl isomerase n=1 Tax=Luteimicrobium album TaxID=1054550 RepID=A0ABQ6HZU2_9MICO|nr:hypothetical protein GCM10025864_17570 [Luteimicrobium album]
MILASALAATGAWAVARSGTAGTAEHRSPIGVSTPPSTGAAMRSPHADTVVARVDGHAITADELRTSAAVSGADLTTAKGRRSALYDIERFKVAQIEAASRGLVTAVDFEDVQRELAKENASRAQDEAGGGVVYGPSSYNLATYYARVETTVEQQLLDDLVRTGEIRPSDAALRAHYRAHVAEYPVTAGTLTVRTVRADDSSSGRRAAGSTAAAVSAGTSLEGAARAHGLHATVRSERLDLADADLARTRPSLAAAAPDLEPGHATVVRDDADGGLLVVQAVSRTAGAAPTFEEVKDETRVRYEHDQYSKHVDRLVSRAHVDVDVDLSRALP